MESALTSRSLKDRAVDDTKSLNDRAKNSGGTTSDEIHLQDDIDSARDAHHHTIGNGPNQVASGADLQALQLIVNQLISGGIPGASVPLEMVSGSSLHHTFLHSLGRKVMAYYFDTASGVRLLGTETEIDINTFQVDFKTAQAITAIFF
jgi:hypothetical protein